MTSSPPFSSDENFSQILELYSLIRHDHLCILQVMRVAREDWLSPLGSFQAQRNLGMCKDCHEAMPYFHNSGIGKQRSQNVDIIVKSKGINDIIAAS